MISQIRGQLECCDDGRALLRCGHVAYEILIPGIDRQRLSTLIEAEVTFHTLHYLEAQGQGTSFIPRLIGFSSPRDRAFFELFTTVKGVGVRKALRSLQMPLPRIARAIAEKDVSMLKTLPEIGKRTAETIIVELADKMDPFLDFESAGTSTNGRPSAARRSLADEAATILATLGEPKVKAVQLVDRVLQADPTLESTEEVVAAAFRLKELG